MTNRSDPPVPGTKTTGRLTRSLRAFRHRNYRLFFLGQLISLTGTWMQSVAQAWLIYRLTGSTVLLGLVGFAGQIPVFALATVGGMIADRYDRHRIVLATQVVSMVLAFLLAGLALAEIIEVWHIFVIACLMGIVNAFDIPARQAFVVDIVGRDDIVNAVALNSTMFNGARMVGPAIAGVLVAAIGEAWCFFANAASYVPVIACLLLMHVVRHVRVPLPGSALGNIAEGFRYTWQTRPIRALLVLLVTISVMGMPYSVLMPVFSDRILNGGARGLGLLMASAGLGAMLGAMSLATRDGIRGLGRWIQFSSLGFGGLLIVFAFSANFWLSAAILVPTGFCMMVTMAAANTLVQSMSPDHLRGRVMAVYSMMFMGMAPFGALYAGAVAERLGVQITVALGGVACLLGSLYFGWRLPVLRAEAREIILTLQMSAGQPAETTSGEGAVVVPPR